MLRFVYARVARIPAAERGRLAELVVEARAAAAFRTTHDHAAYRPDPARPTSARHGMYEANLVLLLLALSGGFPASRLFPDTEDAPKTWHRRVLLWRSSFTEPEWTDFALSLRLRHTWAGERRELEVEPAGATAQEPEAVDLYWEYGHGPEAGALTWSRSYAADLPRKMAVSGGTNDAVVRHTLEPVFESMGDAVMRFNGRGTYTTSVAHDLLRLCLASRALTPPDALAEMYRHCLLWFDPSGSLAPGYGLVADRLAVDAERLPPDLVGELLRMLPLSAASLGSVDVLCIAVAALTRQPSAAQREYLLRLTRSVPFLGGNPRGWAAWVELHDHGLAVEALDGRGGELLEGCDLTALPPTLRHEIRRVAATHYPDVNVPPLT
jgi:hypothetical protein